MTTTQQKPVQLRNLQVTAREAGVGTVRGFFQSQKQVLKDVLPKHVDPDRLLRIALGAMRTTPMLMNASIESLFGAVVQCAQLGLEPNTPLGHAYLIPFNNRRAGKVEVQIVFGYKGLIDLARRSGQIVSIAAHAVYENDDFKFSYGLDEKLEHVPTLNNRGQVIAFYAVAKLEGGGYAFEVMSREQVEAIRDASQNYAYAKDKSKTVWGEHFDEMGRKTVLRRLFKYLPVSIELATASNLDSKAGEESQALDSVLTGEFEVLPEDALVGSADHESSVSGEVNTETGEVTQPEPEQKTEKAVSKKKSQPEPEDDGFDFDME